VVEGVVQVVVKAVTDLRQYRVEAVVVAEEVKLVIMAALPQYQIEHPQHKL